MILLYGMGLSNRGIQKLLDKLGFAYETTSEIVDYSKYEYIVKSPGIMIDKLGEVDLKKVISDIELCYMLVDFKCVGITGTNGKTTTTMLISHISSYLSCGNIGYSIGECLATNHNKYFIVELSSFMLEFTKNFHPKISVLLNATQAHLDYHKTIESYRYCKEKITINQQKDEFLITNLDDPACVKIADKSRASKLYFSIKEKTDCYYKDGKIYLFDQEFMDSSNIKLEGLHNIYNVLASILASRLLDVKESIIKDKIETFKPVSYRLEKIYNNIYNDGKSTNVFSTLNAIKSMNKEVLLICGGLRRDDDYTILDEVTDKIKYVYSYGETKHDIKEYFKEKCLVYQNLEDATISALNDLRDEALLFSPMHASLDEYESYINRSEEFNKIVFEHKK